LVGNKLIRNVMALGVKLRCFPIPAFFTGGTDTFKLQESSSGLGLARRMMPVLMMNSYSYLNILRHCEVLVVLMEGENVRRGCIIPMVCNMTSV